MAYKSALAKAQGLGSAKSGTMHWWMQRVTAVALIPLSFWVILFIKQLLSAPFNDMQQWLVNPINASLLLAWVCIGFYHAVLGLQIVIEDYVSVEFWQISLVWLLKLAGLAGAISSLVLLMKIAVAAG